ncbi:hypothetical protein [Alkalitalea saponilacus]|uniref:N-acetyltransferase domain-containing protein n=1 Tax=Alkalitalea saponilacus TaxID=889453 RepID=A0A1T5HNB1_9BACT|nr:hypothetical protein [Alkalitalea saponilacus]ASB49372.1 hypothetical protein CDL62_09580 [Alkalitalea saponilacus]SKC22030.1 hypothetical protein SAMN03080601_02492 [Alkalitalea saponilacus]
MEITIREVSNQSEFKKFIAFPGKLYKQNNYYVPPLISTENKTLSPRHNSDFNHCDVKLWLASINNEVVGRVAGIIDHRYIEKTGKKYVRFGWFDFIDQQEIASVLLKTVENWAVEHGMTAIHGPYGLSQFDPSGILIEGFNELPTSFGKYNYPYYAPTIESLGYHKETDWLEFRVTVPEKVPEKYFKIAEIVENRYNLSSVPIKSKKDLHQYAAELFTLLNKVYGELYSHFELTPQKIKELQKEFIPMLNPEFVSMVVNADGKMVGFGICLPSLAKAIQKSKGRLFPFGFIRILYALKYNDTIDTLLIAIDSNYKEKGVNALIFRDIGQSIINHKIKFVETTRELEGNRDVQNLWNKFEYRQHKKARCYIKEL